MIAMLAKDFRGEDVRGWWMSEKLDGVRALWDGRRLTSRNGLEFPAPESFRAQLPALPLDGELWLGRGQFQRTLSVVRGADWTPIKYRVFDAPMSPGGFERRWAEASRALAQCQIASIVAHTRCKGQEHLDETLAALTADGAEGVMLREPGSPYDPCRSRRLLKYKLLASAEATVTGYQDGKGRLAGQVGALLCDWDGVAIVLGAGLTDDLRRTPPQRGAVVTFAYCGLTDSGQPRFARYVAARNYE